MGQIESILEKLNQKHIWDEQPVFCFTSDIDWASESVMENYFQLVSDDLKVTLFCTHESERIKQCSWDKGIHPNFLPKSSHSEKEMNIHAPKDYYQRVIETCQTFAPGSKVFRSHRAFDVTDTNHLLKEKYGFEYCSNQITIMQNGIKPVLMESGLINFPVFFEDGTHLYNELDFDYRKYISKFYQPGIKIISFHPMNFVFNSPTYGWMRRLKDSISQDKYKNISNDFIREWNSGGRSAMSGVSEIGIQNTILDIIHFVRECNYKIYSLKQLYELI